MDPAHNRLEQLFAAALEKDSWADRNAVLDRACGDDASLRTRVDKLLQAHARMGSFLESPPVDPHATLESLSPRDSIGMRIGHYKIIEEIGEGGFGTVYLAEQDEPVRRTVALKIIKLGMDTRQVIARFEAERQALALMDHPNIAKVLDAGATETGRPYFVMELVRGTVITEYCDKHKLSARERLELFLPVCHAVQHAHQKGVIHRDLKPNNVLIAQQDDKPVPKVIDFGIAKATSQRLTEKTLYTGFREFVGTPEYMSPEQAELGGLDIDTRTDIYSLGVLLYELLTGTTPFGRQALRGASYDEIARFIREMEPQKPSVRLQTLSDTGDGAEIAARRRTDASALLKSVRGDLDWIVMKALEKDRTRRYSTAKDLADDIERHSRHKPVHASPPGTTYRLRKFVRRNRLAVLVALAVGAALLSGLALATFGFVQATRARDREERQRQLAEARASEARKEAATSATVSRFLQEMLGAMDPSRVLGREVTVRFVLDEAVRKIDEGVLADQPEVEASVRMTLGETYEALGLYVAAEAHVRAARMIRGRLLGDEHVDTLRSDCVLARLLRLKRKFAEAETLLRQTAATQRRVLGEEHPDTLATMSELALALSGLQRLAEAETIHRRTLEIQRRVLGEEHVDTLKSMIHLGAVCRLLPRSAEAESLLRRALEICKRVLGDDHPVTAVTMNNLGLVFEDKGDLGQAETLYRQTYELDCRILGTDHPETQIPMNDLLRVLRGQGKFSEIRPLVASRLASRRTAAERPGASASTVHTCAWELLNCETPDLRDPQAALPFAQRAVELDGGRDADFLATLAQSQQMTGDLEGAIDTQRQAVAQARVGGQPGRPDLESKLFDYLLLKGDLVGAASVPWTEITARLGETLLTDYAPDASLAYRAEAFMKEGRFEEAADLLIGCLTTRQKTLPEGHWLIAETTSLLGAAVAGEGRFDDAETLLLDGHSAMKGNPLAPADRKRLAVERIVQLYESWNKPEKAAEWRSLTETADAGEGGG